MTMCCGEQQGLVENREHFRKFFSQKANELNRNKVRHDDEPPTGCGVSMFGRQNKRESRMNDDTRLL